MLSSRHANSSRLEKWELRRNVDSCLSEVVQNYAKYGNNANGSKTREKYIRWQVDILDVVIGDEIR